MDSIRTNTTSLRNFQKLMVYDPHDFTKSEDSVSKPTVSCKDYCLEFHE